MKDNDWIEIAYIFDSTLGVDELRGVFEFLRDCPAVTLSESISLTSYEDGDRNRSQVDIDDAAAHCLDRDGCGFRIPTPGFEISAFVESQSGLLQETSNVQFRVPITPFQDRENRDPEEIRTRSDRFANVLGSIASKSEPLWGFGRRTGLAIGTDESVSELARRPAPPLYEYNVFDREAVEAIGRDRLQAAPVWHVQELSTGGAFLVLREPPTSCAPGVEPCEHIAAHLGMTFGRTERYS